MPIVVIRGETDHNAKKKIEQVTANGYQSQLSSPSRDSDDDDDDDDDGKLKKQQMMALDMDDVLNLKVYKVSKPHFIDGSVKTSLVGGDVYFIEESTAMMIQTKDNSTTKPSEPSEAKPTLLQKFRAYRDGHPLRSGHPNKGFMGIIRTDELRRKTVKAGQSLIDHVQRPSSEETVAWAIRYVNANEEDMTSSFLRLIQKIKEYERDQAR
jgi:hypothetical protein